MTQFKHQPVLLSQVLKLLQPKSGKRIIDATVGGAGHAQELVSAGAQVLGIDADPEAIPVARQRLNPTHSKVVQGNFKHLKAIASSQGFDPVDAILFDLGVSSHQLDTPQRGFSFQQDAPLAMRMDPGLQVTAADLVNALGRKELYTLFRQLAQERLVGPIAQAIVTARSLKPIKTTGQLASIVEAVYHHRRDKLHPATKVFQALRLAVNDELNNLKASLPQALGLLKPQGRLLVISFHEGEDRIVKHQFKTWAQANQVNLITKKPMTPELSEITTNPRCRSAKLRCVEKL